MILFLDWETTFQIDEKKRTDPSPYNPKNYLVSGGLTADTDKFVWYYCFKHNEQGPDPFAFEDIQAQLDKVTLLVAHNARFELAWLRAAGFKYDGPVADTMIRSYVIARGQKLGMSLEECCIRYNVALKKSALVEDYLKKGIGFEAMPWETVQEYGIGDVQSLKELYYAQLKVLEESPHLWPTINLMEEMCACLCSIEENGICIDLKELDRLEKEFKVELAEHKEVLQKIIFQVMGDTPINLDSPQQLSELIYSRKVTDKETWKKVFNLGTEIRGSVVKTKYKPRMGNTEFVKYIQLYTNIIYKTKAEHCTLCEGKGNIQRIRKDGHPFVKPSSCPNCHGAGYVLIPLKEIAGLRFIPRGPQDAAIGGFSTDKETLERLAETAKSDIAREFVNRSKRINAVSNYIDTVIAGIRRGIRQGNILHAQFLQCVTATGRLAGRDPNTTNIPRGQTFPIKRAFISRFEGGYIIEGDFKQLEFRAAGELSGNKQILEDILNNVDIHTETSKVVGLNRQDSKPHSFAPLFGATPNGKSENVAKYYEFFIKKYDLNTWHQEWFTEVLNTGGYKLPSGREFVFPNTKRLKNGEVTNSTIIKNYRIQSWATADLAQIALVKTCKLFKEYNLKSCVILTVHDSIEIDAHPDEIDICIELLLQGMNSLKEECKRRYNYNLTVPLEAEISKGKNWLEQILVKTKGSLDEVPMAI
jgi:DNA polymerase I-like protein with 3'-5' exonuclease and polymerase domains